MVLGFQDNDQKKKASGKRPKKEQGDEKIKDDRDREGQLLKSGDKNGNWVEDVHVGGGGRGDRIPTLHLEKRNKKKRLVLQ